MWGIRYTIDGDFDFLRAFVLSAFPDGFDDLIDRYD